MFISSATMQSLQQEGCKGIGQWMIKLYKSRLLIKIISWKVWRLHVPKYPMKIQLKYPKLANKIE